MRGALGSDTSSVDRAVPVGIGPASLGYLGTSAYGLTSRQAAAIPRARPPTYGFEGGARLRALAGAHAIEAGDVVRSDVVADGPPRLLLEAVAMEPAVPEPEVTEPVGRFYEPPTERVEARARLPRGPEPSGTLLVSALTASVTTSLLALLLRPSRRQ
jgi:hypothetical protein